MGKSVASLSAQLGTALGMPRPQQPRKRAYEGHEGDSPFRLPSSMDPVQRGRKHGWGCDACGAESGLVFTTKRAMATDGRKHDDKDCKG